MADLIERYKITANLPSVMMNYCNRFNSKQIELITEMIYELENSIESADVQFVRHGDWKMIYSDEHGTAYHCSNCKLITCTDKTINSPLEREEYFCQRCGADMRNKEG